MSNILQPSESFIIAIPYMAIGKYLAEHKNVVNAKYIYVGILASIIFLLLEAKLCSYFFAPVINVIVNPRLEVFVCLVPFVIFVIPALLKIKIKISDSLSKYLRLTSILVYLSHQVLMIILYKLGFLPVGMSFFISTMIVSVLFSVVILVLSSKYRVVKYLY